MAPSGKSINPPLLIGAVALMVGLAALGYALALPNSSSGQTGGTVEVTGSGTVTAKPDTLTIDFAVTTTSPSSSSSALTKNNNEVHTLEASLMGGGIAAKDLQTTNLSVTRGYNSQGNPSGYDVEDDLTATLHDLSKAGKVIDAAQASVGNDVAINNTNYSISNSTGLETTARGDAMRNAVTKARGLAEGGGTSLGRILKITETEQQATPPPLAFNGLSASAGAAKVSTPTVPLRTGTLTVTVQVDVVFALAD
jgi:uncharacterized protein